MFKTSALRSVPVRVGIRRRAHPLSALLFLAFAGSPAGAAELWLSPDTGQLAFAGKGVSAVSFVDQLSFNGSTIRAGDLVAGVREYFVAGNFDVLATDVVRLAPGASSSGVRLVVGNNANILGRVDVSGRSTGEKSGGGGGGGAGGQSQYSEVLNNNAGTGGSGGLNGSFTGLFGNPTPIGGGVGVGTDAFFVTTDVGVTWININDPGITGLGKGGSGLAGSVGGAGSPGRSGLSGLAGGAGSRGLNDSSSRFARGGQGGAGASGNPIVGLGGAGGTGGAGGSGAALSFDTFLSDAAKAGFHTSTAATNGARGADGGNGTAGAKGLTGQTGSDGNAAPGVRRVGDGLTVTPEQAVLVGGWGGGGGGAGGQGSQGSGGGGGGGGGAGGGGGGGQKCPSGIVNMCGIPGAVVGTVLALGEQSTYLVGTEPGPTVGGPGGIGGAGGGAAEGAIGGMGGVGAPGTNGGGGGGVVEINARGRVLVGGVVAADGGSGSAVLWPGLPGSGGGASSVGAQGGTTLRGALGGAGGGGSGGSGGLSGLGGIGGDGGAAGIGAGGGGGTVKLIGTQVLVADGGQVTVQGGAGGASLASRGALGDIYVGSNDPGLTDVAGGGRRIVDPTGANTGARSENMYRYDNKTRTAYIPDVLGEHKGSSIGLAGGAEVFGLLEGRGPDGQSLMSNLVRQAGADAPAGAVAALWRIDSVDLGSFQTMAFASSDLVFFVNLGNTALKNPAFVSRAENQAQRIGFVMQLYQRGWARSYPFGSGEDSLIESLAPGQVWVTTVEKGSARRFDFEADGLASYDNLLGQNQRAFLIAAAPVPEVGKAAMWLSGLPLLLMLRRRRNGVLTQV